MHNIETSASIPPSRDAEPAQRAVAHAKHIILGMHRALTFCLLGEGEKAVKELETEGHVSTRVLNFLTLRQAIESSVAVISTDTTPLSGSLTHLEDVRGTPFRIMRYEQDVSNQEKPVSESPEPQRVFVEYRDESGCPTSPSASGHHVPRPLSGAVVHLSAFLRSINSTHQGDVLIGISNLRTTFGTLKYLGCMWIPSTRIWALIFVLPNVPLNTNLRDILTLETLLQKEQVDSGAFKRNLETRARFRLAHHCCLHLLAFHSCGWVHKDIRSANVVLIPKTSTTPHLASTLRQYSESKAYFQNPELQAYFAGFGLARRTSDPTGLSETVEMEVNIYRHPERQGVPTLAFSQIHDIYALGVVLCEIGLCRNMRYKFRTLLERLRAEGTWLTPSEIKTQLTRMCVDDLPLLMGVNYTRAVLRCLTGDFGVEEDDDQQTALGAAFQRLVLEPIERGTQL